MNFGFDIIDKRAYAKPNEVAVRWHWGEARVFEISNDDLRHHSDVCAYYLSRLGVAEGSVVTLYGLERGFEFAIVLTAINKLGAVAMFDEECVNPVSVCNEEKAYAVICHCLSEAIESIDANQSSIQTLEIKISFGYPYPPCWFDLHTGMRLAGVFKPRKRDFSADNPFLVFRANGRRIVKDYLYPFSAKGDRLCDKFFRAMIADEVFEF